MGPKASNDIRGAIQLKIAQNYQEAELLLGRDTASRCGFNRGAQRDLLRRGAGVAATLVRELDTCSATPEFRSALDGVAVALAAHGAAAQNDEAASQPRYAARTRTSV